MKSIGGFILIILGALWTINGVAALLMGTFFAAIVSLVLGPAVIALGVKLRNKTPTEEAMD